MSSASHTLPGPPSAPREAILPPGHRVPAWVNFFRVLKDQKRFQAYCHERYGSNFMIRLPLLPPIVVVGGPELAKAAFRQPNEVLDAYPNSVIHFVTGETSLIYAEGERHARERRRLNPHLLGNGAALHWPQVLARLEEDLERWPEDAPVSLQAMVKRVVTGSMVRRFLSLPAAREQELIDSALELTNALVPHLFFLALIGLGPSRERPNILLSLQRRLVRMISFFIPGYRALVRLRDQAFEQFFGEAVQAARAGRDPEGFLAHYLHSIPDDEETPTDEELRDLLATLTLVGVDSTTSTTSWVLYYLMKDASLTQRILGEAAEAGINELGDCTPDKLASCRTLDHVISEVLRYRTPTPITARRTCKPLELAGYRFPADVWMMISIYHLHHHTSDAPEIDKFRPERFDRAHGELDAGKICCPFGAGVHKCPGMDLSFLVAKSLALGALLRWEMTSCDAPDDDIPADRKPRTLRFANLTPPDGLSVQLHRKQRPVSREKGGTKCSGFRMK